MSLALKSVSTFTMPPPPVILNEARQEPPNYAYDWRGVKDPVNIKGLIADTRCSTRSCHRSGEDGRDVAKGLAQQSVGKSNHFLK